MDTNGNKLKKEAIKVLFELLVCGILLYFMWVFHKSIEIELHYTSTRVKYLSLYDLFKLDEDLKKRKLSFDHLDEFAEKYWPIRPRRRTTLKDIDEQYEETEKKE